MFEFVVKCKNCGDDVKLNINLPKLGEPLPPELLADERTVEQLKDRVWTTEPPTQEGWYWAKSETVEMVRVSNDYPETDVGLRVWSSYEVRARAFSDFTHWLGPLPTPEHPTET